MLPSFVQLNSTLKNVDSCFNTNIYSFLETSSGQSYNLYLNVVHFLTTVLIRHLWQLKTVVFQHLCLKCAVLSGLNKSDTNKLSSLKIYSEKAQSIYAKAWLDAFSILG
jgi:hypothetical protein